MGFKVLLVAGTHGNEVNAPWLFDQWMECPDLIKTHNIEFCSVIGNPKAREVGRRYLDRDLNRSFNLDLLDAEFHKGYEIKRAKEMLNLYGKEGEIPCQLVIDFHSTTSSMGNSLVVYGRRPIDLALAALIQSKLGLPIYLHEEDNSQTGFMVSAWPSGLVVEIGPVPQGVLDAETINKTKITLETLLKEISNISKGEVYFPNQLVVHRHMKSIDYPRNKQGIVQAFVHPSRQGKDWSPIKKGDPLFLSFKGDVIRFDEEDGCVPVFINEAAYLEKNIAMSLAKREVIQFSTEWELAIKNLIRVQY